MLVDFTVVNDWVMDPSNPSTNIKLADWYFERNALSPAYTHYLRALDFLDKDQYEIKYYCLCMLSYIHYLEGNRWLGAIQYARFAKAEMPNRPEAYLLLAAIKKSEMAYRNTWEQYEWIQIYENAKIGCLFGKVAENVPISPFYDGLDSLKSLYLESLYRICKVNELDDALKTVRFDNPLNPNIMNLVHRLYSYKMMKDPYLGYFSNKHELLKIKFNESEFIKENYSECMQDMFVLTVLNGKKDGTYLEIGSGHPVFHSNTKLLEEFEWKGISIDSNDQLVKLFNLKRKNKAICANAMEVESYSELLDVNLGIKTVDYLQIDLDPSASSFECLKKLPLDELTFNVITFKTDAYQVDKDLIDEEREILSSHGYVLIGENIKCNESDSFEDWWVHLSVLEKNESLKDIFKETNGLIQKIFYK